MRFIKPRKPRGTKLNGEKSIDFCEGCKMPYCNPFAASQKYQDKVMKRRRQGVCTACGQSPCKCKSRLHISKPIMITHNKN